MPVFSIIAPIYNMAPWLAPALESCLGQSHREVEILVVDDGSQDNGPDIARAYEKLDSRVRLISQANAGVGAARQHGQDAAGGDYITWLDTDDFLDRRTVEAWLRTAGQDGADLVCGNAVAFSSRTFNARRYFPHPAATGLHFDAAPAYWKSKVLWRWAASLPFLRRTGIRHKPFKLGQDVCFMFEALLRAGHFAQTEATVYYFRQEHKSAHASLPVLVEHGFAHFNEVRRILLEPPDGRPRIKPLIKYLNENYWRDIRKTAPRLTGADAMYEERIIALGLSLFAGLDPAWFRAAALAPEVKEEPAFLPLADALTAGDAPAARAVFAALRARPHKAPDKRNAFHSLRHTFKSYFNPLAYAARFRLGQWEARAAARSGVPRPDAGKARQTGR